MKIWKISQELNNTWDTYDSAIVFAETEGDAMLTHPCGDNDRFNTWDSTWCPTTNVIVEYLGTTDRIVPNKTVICASFNAG